MILQISQRILGLIAFFLPGFLLSYIILPRTDLIKRMLFSVVLAVSLSTIIGCALYFLNQFTPVMTISILAAIDLLFLIIILISHRPYVTNSNKDFWYLLFFSIIATGWRLHFLKSIENFSHPYNYACEFFGKTAPNLGFYTNMVIDHSRFMGIHVFSKVSGFLSIDNVLGSFFGIFLICFLFLTFLYLIFFAYRDRKMAYLGVALMALGPIEIFHSTLDFFGHPFSYIALFSLFMLYKSEERIYFWVALLVCTTMVFTYFTSAVINALTSVGFIIALFLKKLCTHRDIKESFIRMFKDRKTLYFALITIVSTTFIFGITSFKGYSSGSIELVTKHITTYPILKYRDPAFVGLSAIRWQMVFFFLCGLTFILYVIKRRDFSEGNLDLLTCLAPVLITSYAFSHVNLPTRIFNYFGFFGLLTLKIPKKYLNIFFGASLAFMVLTSLQVAKDKKIFFEIPEGEAKAASWIDNSLEGKIFSDQVFINQLISKGYYNVTGTNDDDPLVYKLFYQNDVIVFLDAVDCLRDDLGVKYIALTDRMRDKYILMLNIPQGPLMNIRLYEENLGKIYDDGNIRVYKID